MQTQDYSLFNPNEWYSAYGTGTRCGTFPVISNAELTADNPHVTIESGFEMVVSLGSPSSSEWDSLDPEGPSNYFVATSSNQRAFIPKRIEFRAQIEKTSRVLSLADQIALIRSALSLRVTELAAIMEVERPTVYGWIAEEFSPQHEKQYKLAALLTVAKKWRSLSTIPLGKGVRESALEGQSLLDLLKLPKIDQRKTFHHLELLAAAESSGRAPVRRGSVSEAMRRHGLDPEHAPQDDSEIAAVSGKRFEND